MIVPVALVNAHDYPWPALVQGVGMIVVSVGAVIYMIVSEHSGPKETLQEFSERMNSPKTKRMAWYKNLMIGTGPH